MGGRVFDRDLVALARQGMCGSGSTAAGMVSRGRRKKRAHQDGLVIEALNEIVGAHLDGVFGCVSRRGLRILGQKWNHERV